MICHYFKINTKESVDVWTTLITKFTLVCAILAETWDAHHREKHKKRKHDINFLAFN